VFAVAAAVMFLIAAIKAGPDAVVFWLYLGLMLWALHFVFDALWPVATYTGRRRRAP
jgi:hypothetical protein